MDVDVAILGGGMAGASLALQLRREVPNASVAVFEREVDPSGKVGESTTEIGSAYLRRLGLTDYLHGDHLLKNGLRFFFDREGGDAPLDEMAEIGTTGFPYHPAFQLDRARLDEDLRRRAEGAGAAVVQGVRIAELAPGTNGERHRVRLDGGPGECTARWLVDASGRARLLARALGQSRVAYDHPLSAAWGRFEGTADIDSVGPPQWLRRAGGTPRFPSTNHLMYPGYWIWFIPLASGRMSVGVVCERSAWNDALRTPDGMLAFLRRHRAARDLLGDAVALDHAALGNIAYGCARFISPSRWGATGEAAAFTDPLYSPGADFIALANDLLTETIARDLGGESPSDLAQCIDAFDRSLKLRLDSSIRLYRGQYPLLGSRDAFALKWRFDIHLYYNVWLDEYLRGAHRDLDAVHEQLRFTDNALRLLDNFGGLFREVGQRLRRDGRYFDGNAGGFEDALGTIDFIPGVGPKRTRKQVLRALSNQCNDVRAAAFAALGERDVTPLPLYEYMTARGLDSPA